MLLAQTHPTMINHLTSHVCCLVRSVLAVGILGLVLCQNIQAVPHIVLQSMTFSINVVLSIIYTMSLCLFTYIVFVYAEVS